MDKSSLLACWSRPSACSAEQCLMSRSSNASFSVFSEAVDDIELCQRLWYYVQQGSA